MRPSRRFLVRLALAGGLAASTLTLVPASADVSQCAPITIDGQEAACIVLSSTPVTEPNGDPGVQLTLTLSVFGQSPVTETETETVPVSTVNSVVDQYCFADGQAVYGPDQWSSDGSHDSWAAGREYGIGQPDSFTPNECDGIFGLTIESYGPETSVTPPSVGTSPWQPVSEPYHIPQICITTSPGACVGPYDGTINPTLVRPNVTQPGINQEGATRLCYSIGQFSFFTYKSADSYGSYGYAGKDQTCAEYVNVVAPPVQGP